MNVKAVAGSVVASGEWRSVRSYGLALVQYWRRALSYLVRIGLREGYKRASHEGKKREKVFEKKWQIVSYLKQRSLAV